MPFPKEFIDTLKMRNPIEDVIGHYVVLKRAGSNMSGLCPFHSEKSPSFTVFSDHFHCFGCSAGGDVITFVMKMENLDYPDAIRFLADRAGLAVPEDTQGGYQKKEEKILTRERSFAMNKLAARHFYDNLMSPDGEAARAYFFEKRKLSKATINHFGLGYAKDSFHDLIDFLTANGYTIDEIKANFLCGISEKTGRPFDMFHNRVMFPIIDLSGNVIAFGGRVLDDSKPKYLNSSDTVVFKKSRNLFALNYAKKSVLGDGSTVGYVQPGELIVCEGYMDVIALHQAGFTNAVATLGTAITSEHARVISRFAKTVFLSYDSDEAGQKATSRAIAVLSEVGIDPKVITYSGGKDPDEYIKSFGAEAFNKLIHASVGTVDYRLEKILAKYDLNIPDDKVKAVKEVVGVLVSIRSEVTREIYVKRLAEKVGLSEMSIEAEMRRDARYANKKSREKFNDDMQRAYLRYDDKINPDAARDPNIAAVERRIIGILLLYPSFFDTCAELNDAKFVTPFDKALFERLRTLHENDEPLEALNETYTPDQMGYILEMRREREAMSVNGEDVLRTQLALLASLADKKNDTPETFEDSIARLRAEKLGKKSRE